MKIFLGLDDTCGYYTRLESGLKSLGVSCALVNAFPNPKYEFDRDLGIVEKWLTWVGKKTSSLKRGSVSRFCWIGIKGLSLFVLLLWSLLRYDVYIFSGGTTFLFSYDLWLLKLLKKRVIVVYHGSDSRAPYINPVIVGSSGDFNADACVAETKAIKKRLKKIERYADIIINNPNASHLHEGTIINWFCIGSPFYCPSISENDDNNSLAGDPCVIVHAPSRPGAKGSAQIEKSINALKEKGHNIKYVKLVGKPNSEVLEALSTCDFVVDELFSDVILAGFAGEAASFGKPAVVGMYGYDKIKASIAEEKMIPPVLNCSPDDVESAIEKLIVDKEYRLSLGKRARKFIKEQWSIEGVAKRFILLAKNEIPESWWFDTKKVNHLHGWGITEQRTKALLRTILESHGTSALQLSNNPTLEQAFVDFAYDNQKPC
jgi:hypothetical protein